MEKSEEIFPIVDELGNVLGRASRSECHSGSKLLHPVVHLHIFNTKGDLFMQKRSPSKDIQPDKWDTASAGHIDWGETPDIAVRREVLEELGIEHIEPHYLLCYIIENTFERELTYCYYAIYEGDIKIDQKEVSAGRFWTFAEIEKQLGQGIFTYNFEEDYYTFLNDLRNKLFGYNFIHL